MSKKTKKQQPFGKMLRDYLDSRGIKYAWLTRQCKDAGIDKFRLNRIFAGSELQYGEAIYIARALQVPLESLSNLSEIKKLAA